MVTVAVLAGTPGPAINRCVRVCLAAGAAQVAVFVTTPNPAARPDSSLLGEPRVTLTELEWHDSFAGLRNEALDRLPGQWVLFVDADEWPAAALTDLDSLVDGLDRERVYTPTIREVHSQADMIGVPRLVFSDSDNQYVGRVHEYLRKAPGRSGADSAPEPLGFLLHHDGYDPELVDLDAKARRNLALGEMDLAEDPDDVRSLHFLLRDGVDTHDVDRAAELVDRLAANVRSNPGYSANGFDAEWYFTLALPMAAEVALRHGRPELVDNLARRMIVEGAAPADGEYYRAGARHLQGRADVGDLARLMRFRHEHADTGPTSLSSDGRHLDAMIVVLLAHLKGPDTARRYWQECDSWTDGFVEDSWPRGLLTVPQEARA